MSLKAYEQTLKSGNSPRDNEYRLFGQVTKALMDAAPLERTDPRVIDALDWNRRLWTALAADCADADNQLPPPARAGIISLSLFISRYTTQIMAQAMPVAPLIDINRTIMQGLAAKAA